MLGNKDTAVLGMMVFALFLGAGNVIFPPMAGYQAGSHWLAAALGFIVTGVGLPFLTLLVVAAAGNGEALSRGLPAWAATLFWCALYLVIGPTFAMPRVVNVAYELGALPLGLPAHDATRLVFACAFGAGGLWFMLRPGSLINHIGRVMTPALLLLLAAVAAGVLLAPVSPVAPTGTSDAFTAAADGLVSGYQTMDVLGAMAFGALVAQMLSLKGITRSRDVARVTAKAGLISAALLALLYLCLFYLGATAGTLAEGAPNGGQILARYVDALFGPAGSVLMAGIILLACLTTLVGVTSASAAYFARTFPALSYPRALAACMLATVVVANFGLDQLIRVTVPVLFLIYPPAIALVVLYALKSRLSAPAFSAALTLPVATLLGLADALNAAGLLGGGLLAVCRQLPLFAQGLGWPLLSALALPLSAVLPLARRMARA